MEAHSAKEEKAIGTVAAQTGEATARRRKTFDANRPL